MASAQPRRCGTCGALGHNARTCPSCVPAAGAQAPAATTAAAAPAPVAERSLFRSTSMPSLGLRRTGSLDNLASAADALALDDGGGVGCSPPDEEGQDTGPGDAAAHDRERKKGVPWTEQEHRRFLLGLQKLGKGDWRGIARQYVQSRTPTQVASHAQKYFIRQNNLHKRKRRSSLFDIVASATPPPALPLQLHATVGQWPLLGVRHEVAGVPGPGGVPGVVHGGATTTTTPASLLPGAPGLFGGLPSGTPAVLPLHMPPSVGDIIFSAPLGEAHLRGGVANGSGANGGHHTPSHAPPSACAAAAAAAAAAAGSPGGGDPAAATAALLPLLWQQYLLSGGALGGVAFHRPGPQALRDNPLLFKPTPSRATSATWGLIKSASMPELGASAAELNEDDFVFPPLRPSSGTTSAAASSKAAHGMNGRGHSSNGHMASIAEGGDPTSSGGGAVEREEE